MLIVSPCASALRNCPSKRRDRLPGLQAHLDPSLIALVVRDEGSREDVRDKSTDAPRWFGRSQRWRRRGSTSRRSSTDGGQSPRITGSRIAAGATSISIPSRVTQASLSEPLAVTRLGAPQAWLGYCANRAACDASAVTTSSKKRCAWGVSTTVDGEAIGAMRIGSAGGGILVTWSDCTGERSNDPARHGDGRTCYRRRSDAPPVAYAASGATISTPCDQGVI
jgi:hypothetical protein